MVDRDDRRPAVAGTFYPAEPEALRRLVLECLGRDTKPGPSAVAAIAPHAGLVYSGRCAGAVFRALSLPPLVIILAPNHTGCCAAPGGASLWSRGTFLSPLGRSRIAAGFCAALARQCPLAGEDPGAHLAEHAIEVELPFIHFLAPDTAIVPIVLAWDDWPSCRALATALVQVIQDQAPDALVLASSDMTHYESAASAGRKDRMALAAVERLDGEGLLNVCRRERVTMCGRAPAAVALETARQLGAAGAETVDYRHSGMVTGDDSRVVAYAGVVIR